MADDGHRSSLPGYVAFSHLTTRGVAGVAFTDMILGREDRIDPEQEILIADSVGLALLVVLESLTPHERLAFVLHDMFDVPFEEIASIVGCTPVAAR